MADRHVVRCKMQLVERKESSYWGKGVVGLVFQAVTGAGDGDTEQMAEDKRFHDATPSGRLEFATVNMQAANGLEIGGKYYVDVSRAD